MSEQNICIDAFVAPAARKPALPTFGFGQFLTAYKAWKERRATANLLRGLNDRQLRDIGIVTHDLTPALQDVLAAGREQHEMLALFPHIGLTPRGAHRRKPCD